MRFLPTMSTTAKTALGLSAVAALGAGLVMGGQIPNPSAFSSISWDGVKAALSEVASSAADVATSARNSAMVSSIVGPQSGLVHLGLPMGSREPWAFCSPDTDFQPEQGALVTDVSVNNPKSFSFLTMDPKRTNLGTIQKCFLSQVPQAGRYSLSEESFVSAPNPSTSSWLNWCSTGCNSAVTREDIESATSGGFMDKVKGLAKVFTSEPTTGHISCSEPMSIGKNQLRRFLNSDSTTTTEYMTCTGLTCAQPILDRAQTSSTFNAQTTIQRTDRSYSLLYNIFSCILCSYFHTHLVPCPHISACLPSPPTQPPKPPAHQIHYPSPYHHALSMSPDSWPPGFHRHQKYILLDLDWSSPTYLQTCLTPPDTPNAGAAHPTPIALSSGSSSPSGPTNTHGQTTNTPYSRPEPVSTAAASHPVDSSRLMLLLDAITMMEDEDARQDEEARQEEEATPVQAAVEADSVPPVDLPPHTILLSDQDWATLAWRFWDIPLQADDRHRPAHVVIWESMFNRSDKRRALIAQVGAAILPNGDKRHTDGTPAGDTTAQTDQCCEEWLYLHQKGTISLMLYAVFKLEWYLDTMLPRFTPTNRPTDMLKMAKRENRLGSPPRLLDCMGRVEQLRERAKGFREAGQDVQAAWVLLSAWSDLAPLYPTEWLPACYETTTLPSDASRLSLSLLMELAKCAQRLKLLSCTAALCDAAIAQPYINSADAAWACLLRRDIGTAQGYYESQFSEYGDLSREVVRYFKAGIHYWEKHRKDAEASNRKAFQEDFQDALFWQEDTSDFSVRHLVTVARRLKDVRVYRVKGRDWGYPGYGPMWRIVPA